MSFSATSGMNRGDRREPIFKDEADRQRFVETLAEVVRQDGPGWQTLYDQLGFVDEWYSIAEPAIG